MSHTSTVKSIQIKSIKALQSAVQELAANGIRCELRAGGVPRAYFANQQGMGAADYVLHLADAKYDIGFYKNADDVYEARTDFFAQHVERVLGATLKPGQAHTDQSRLGKLFQMYALHATAEVARKQGHMVRRINKMDGTVALEISGPNL